jgi:fucose permease
VCGAVVGLLAMMCGCLLFIPAFRSAMVGIGRYAGNG